MDRVAFKPDPLGPFPAPDDPRIPDFPRIPRIPDFPFEKPVIRRLRWGPAKIRILIVADSSCSYSDTDGFGLGIMLEDAFDPDHPDHPEFARFEFTKAHRQDADGVTPGFDDFEFTAGSLDDFDELWLFGVSTAAPYLSNDEIDVIHAFMDRGGGVLAMGDHEDLGLGLCGGIQRVRSMRKWWFETPAPPAGMLKAPDNADLTRNDTVHAPPGGDVNDGSQSDSTPQRIYPNYRYRWTTWPSWYPGPFARLVKYPHPVLCGPRGAITVFPDHAHEGDCILPDAAFASEYPGGVPVEIVARGKNVVGRIKSGNEIVDDREFGLIGAWDGHDDAADRGRVLVDSTWHHWFNTNLVGLRAAGSTDYADILAYYRNCAVWLAPKAEQARMRRAGTLIILTLPSLFEHALTWKKLDPDLFYFYGVYARDALGRVASRCQSTGWLFDLLGPHLEPEFARAIDPKHVESAAYRNGLDARVSAATIDHTMTTILGAAINALAVKANERGFHELDKLHDEFDEIVAKGAKEGARVAKRQREAACECLKALR